MPFLDLVRSPKKIQKYFVFKFLSKKSISDTYLIVKNYTKLGFSNSAVCARPGNPEKATTFSNNHSVKYSRVQKSIENFIFRPIMAIFWRAGMREEGLPLPLAF